MKRVKITYDNEILGKGVFWQGSYSELEKCRNIPARKIAGMCFRDGKTHKCGMWTASQISGDNDEDK